MNNIIIPKRCPCCNTELKVDGEYLICPNKDGCLKQICGRIKKWISELNILELGDVLVEKLVENGLVENVADLYLLEIDELSNLERMGKQSATNVYNAIWAKSEVDLDVLLGALSIPMIGSSTIRMVMNAGYDTLHKIQTMTLNQIENVNGIGPVKAKSLYDGLKANERLINDLITYGVQIKEKVQGKLNNKSFALTGTMTNKRSVLEKMITDNGGTIKSSVGKGLDILVINDVNSASSKAVAARKFGTKLISEDDLLKMIG